MQGGLKRCHGFHELYLEHCLKTDETALFRVFRDTDENIRQNTYCEFRLSYHSASQDHLSRLENRETLKIAWLAVVTSALILLKSMTAQLNFPYVYITFPGFCHPLSGQRLSLTSPFAAIWAI